MPELNKGSRSPAGAAPGQRAGHATPGNREAKPPPSAEPIDVEARSFQMRLPAHPIYGDDALDPGTRLLADLVDIGEGDSVLVVGGGSGLLPVLAARLASRGRVVVFSDQLPEAAQVDEALRLNRAENVRVVRSADLAALAGERFGVALLGTAFESSRETLTRHIREVALLLLPGGRLYLHGGKREGIEPAADAVHDVLGNVATLGYRKGHRVVAGERGEAVRAQWNQEAPGVVGVSVGGEAFEIETRPGVFATGALDEGTRLLVESLAVRADDIALDLGCGSGIVGLLLARRTTEGRVILADSDLGAVELTRRNVARNGVTRAEARASDAYSALGDLSFDLIASNPPFHVGRTQSPAVVERFIAGAPARLAPGGRLYVVANRFLRYESLFPDAFEPSEVLAETSKYRVLRAVLAGPRDNRHRRPDGD